MAKTFEIKGLNKLLSKIEKLPKQVVDEVDAELNDGALAMAQDAQRRAPVDLGGLRAGISYFRHGPLQFEVISDKHYSPYVEWGTGALVQVPAELESYANQFRGKGVKQVNLPPRPFFFPALEKVKPEIIKNIKEVLARLK